MAATNRFGYLASFDNAGDLLHAAEKVRDAGFQRWDVVTPFPIHGMDAAMGLTRSKVPRFTLVGGIAGFTIGMLMIAFMNWIDYPLIVHGKPFFSPVVAFPVSYELTILLAAFGSIGGMFLLNGLPRHYHPMLCHDKMPRATNDQFFIFIESSDPKFNADRTKDFLGEIGGKEISELED
jgi:hypothetical protein